MTTKLTAVKIIFTRTDERGKKHRIEADLSKDGYQQWGAERSILGDNVEVLTAIEAAALEHLEE